MKIEILSVTDNAEKLIEKAGRTCYKSDSKTDETSYGEFIKKLIKSGHLSVLEHASVTIRLKEISRALTHQLIRHRLCSYSQQSQRYVKESGFSYVIPHKVDENPDVREIFTKEMKNIRIAYKKLIDSGVLKEDARYLLPNACHTELVFTANFRELRHIMLLRGYKSAQWEIRELFIDILKEVKKIAPNCFYDLIINDEKKTISSELDDIFRMNKFKGENNAC